jgi:hypothetical protein
LWKMEKVTAGWQTGSRADGRDEASRVSTEELARSGNVESEQCTA